MTTGRVVSTPISRTDLLRWARIRAIRFHRAGRLSRFNGALERALELFDPTATDPRWLGHRCQEILRAREEFCRLFFDPEVPPESAEGLRR